MLNTKSNNNKKSSQSEVTKKVTADFRNFFEKDEASRDIYESLKVDNAREIKAGSKDKAILIEVTENREGALRSYFSELVKKFENSYEQGVVIIPKRRITNGNTYRRYIGKNTPRHNTLSAVYNNVLEDLVYPAVIVGKRVRYPQGKSSLYRVHIDPFDKDHIEYKTGIISAAYKVLTNRDLAIEFPEQ